MSTNHFDSRYYNSLPDSFLDILYYKHGNVMYWAFLAGYKMLYKLDLIPLTEEGE